MLLLFLETKLICCWILSIPQVLASAILSPFEGPHSLPGDLHPQNQQPNQVTVQRAGRWLAKLQLAHFCLTGMYPTWMHRLCGHSLVAESETSSRLYHRPNTARLVGLLLGAQAVATLIQTSSSALSRWLIRREQMRPSSSSAQRPEIPAVVFQDGSTTGSERTSTNNNATSICSICKMERCHPAAPSSCGHVFCWRCLVQWVSAVRAECPLCRSPCRPQDIVALYNYTPKS